MRDFALTVKNILNCPLPDAQQAPAEQYQRLFQAIVRRPQIYRDLFWLRYCSYINNTLKDLNKIFCYTSLYDEINRALQLAVTTTKQDRKKRLDLNYNFYMRCAKKIEKGLFKNKPTTIELSGKSEMSLIKLINMDLKKIEEMSQSIKQGFAPTLKIILN